MQLTLCIVTKNKAMHTTTLHTAMTLNMICMIKGIHMSIHFVPHGEQSVIQKNLKGCDRLIWIDYGVSVNQDTLEKLINSETTTVVPCVTEEVDWVQFRKKTLENSTEAVNQRALKFDIEAGSKNEYISGVPRIFCMDSKAVLKKLRDSDSKFNSFEQLRKLGLKISVLRSAPVTCHYVYECIGNILESSGVRATK